MLVCIWERERQTDRQRRIYIESFWGERPSQKNVLDEREREIERDVHRKFLRRETFTEKCSWWEWEIEIDR